MLHVRPVHDACLHTQTTLCWCRFLLEGLGELQQRLEARGSRLHFVLGQPDRAIVAALRALAPAAGRIDLYHHLGIGSWAASEEAAVSAAFLACGRELGMPCEVHRVWVGHTLFHPEDALPALRAARSERGGGRRAAREEDAADTAAGVLPAAGTAAFQVVPHVMTDFRKARQYCQYWLLHDDTLLGSSARQRVTLFCP